MDIETSKLLIDTDGQLSACLTPKIRGYLGVFFKDNLYAHQHYHEGGLRYRYPYVQYKVVDNKCLIIGFKEGREVVHQAFHYLNALNLGDNWHQILDKGLESYVSQFSLTEQAVQYSFISPWLALNEKNYRKYLNKSKWHDRKKLLESILAGNLISVSKGLGYTVPGPIEANIIKLKGISTSLKGNPMLGFMGDFSVNFAIPDYWGIGKSVSRGFGTVIKADNPCS